GLARRLTREVARLAERDLDAARGRVARDARARRAAAHDEQIELFAGEPPDGGRAGRGRRHSLMAMWSSSSWRFATPEGASVIRSVPFCVFGKAMTSRRDSAPQSSMARRSTPAAMPPWGGGPNLK